MKTYKDYRLDRFQREALQAIRAGDHVLVSAPTGCGKTLIAEFAIEQALERGERIIYTAPIKALSNQKFRDFGAMYGARVGIMTGDVTINPGADALIMTTEIFRNTVFDDPERLADVRYVIHDEVHYLDDPDRGTVWEESIIFSPPKIRFIGLSATISNLDQLAGWIREVRPGRLRVVKETRRPVPLHLQVWNGERAFDIERMKGVRFALPDQSARALRREQRAPKGRGRRGRRSKRSYAPERAERNVSGDPDQTPGAEAEARGSRHGRREKRAPRARGRMGVVERMRALIDYIVELEHLPCIVFVFSRQYVERYAERCMRLDLLAPTERRELEKRWRALALEFGLDLSEPRTHKLHALLMRGIAFHHAGMLPTHKEIVERLFTSGLIKLLFATETFALGVNMPARAVAFETLKKFDGIKRDWMRSRSFLQMAGRAGRRGIDREGNVYANIDPIEDRVPEVRAVMLGRPEEVDSRFNLSYATLLKLYSHLEEGIYTACERSFAYYRHRKHRSSPFRNMVSLVRRRIALLQECGYLEGARLTTKGMWASMIYGYEVQLAEFLAGGLLERLDARELATLLVAIVYESKRDTWAMPLPRRLLKPLQQETGRLLGPLLEREAALKLPRSKPLDWGLARASWAWAEGAPFEELLGYTDAQPGDVVRCFRMAIQLIRQLHKPLQVIKNEEPERAHVLETLLHETHRRLKRDEVDAERQLRQSLHADGSDRALEALAPERLTEVRVNDEALDHLLHDELHVDAPPRAAADEPGADPRAPSPERDETAPAQKGANDEQEKEVAFFDLDAEER